MFCQAGSLIMYCRGVRGHPPPEIFENYSLLNLFSSTSRSSLKLCFLTLNMMGYGHENLLGFHALSSLKFLGTIHFNKASLSNK